eukprot:2109331-Prymnesium_polylepis.1
MACCTDMLCDWERRHGSAVQTRVPGSRFSSQRGGPSKPPPPRLRTASPPLRYPRRTRSSNAAMPSVSSWIAWYGSGSSCCSW